MSATRFFMSGVLGLALAVSSRSSARAQQTASPTENEVKAAFLYHFAQLVTWPENAEADPKAPVVIVVLGADSFAERLEATIGGENVRGRPLKVRRAATSLELTDAPQILFIGSADRIEGDRALAVVAKSPTLTVSAQKGFTRRGGMIEFRLVNDRVGFDINAQAAASAGLKISSQLLKIARIVEPAK